MDLALRPLTRKEFHRAIEAGVYGDQERLELLEGMVVLRMTIEPPYAGTVRIIARWLRGVAPSEYFVSEQAPLAIEPLSEPEPDIAVVEGELREFLQEHPRPDQVRLVVEVADSSLAGDLGIKLGVYARARIAEYWVVDIKGRRIVCHREPVDGIYSQVSERRPDDPITPPWDPAALIRVQELLP